MDKEQEKYATHVKYEEPEEVVKKGKTAIELQYFIDHAEEDKIYMLLKYLRAAYSLQFIEKKAYIQAIKKLKLYAQGQGFYVSGAYSGKDP